MLSCRTTIAIVLLPLLAAVAAVADGAEPAGKTGLVVDGVTLKGVGAEGVEVELRYWLVDVEELPGHPSKTTLIMDEETNEGVMLRKLQPIASAVSPADLDTVPPATLTFWDGRGVIRPGRPVSIAVAGLVVKHVVPQAGPDYQGSDLGETRRQLDSEARERLPEDATLEVLEAKLGGEGGLLHVWFRTTGVDALAADGKYTYVLDPETGERFDILRVPRLGLMAPKHLSEYEAGSYLVIRVPGDKIKPGQKITVVVEGLRQDNVMVK